MKILIVEDSLDIQEAISLCFEIHWSEAQIYTVRLGADGITKVESESPDIVILDLGLPDIDGFKVLKEIRTFSDVPVISLTVRGEEIDKVRGLELGADDYILKPFSHMELLARVKAVLRRSHMTELKEDEKIIFSPTLAIDFSSRIIIKDSQKIKLTPTEFNLLRYMARNEGKVLTHHTLLSKVWGEEYTDSSDYLKVYIQRLRDKLEIDPANPSILISERGVGY